MRILSTYLPAAILGCCLVACYSQDTRAQSDTAAAPDKNSSKVTEHKEQKPTSKDKDLDKIVCRTEAPVGSRIGTRVCMSRRRWIEQANRGRKMLEDANRRSVTTQRIHGG